MGFDERLQAAFDGGVDLLLRGVGVHFEIHGEIFVSMFLRISLCCWSPFFTSY
jgi:hypothetical protein